MDLEKAVEFALAFSTVPVPHDVNYAPFYDSVLSSLALEINYKDPFPAYLQFDQDRTRFKIRVNPKKIVESFQPKDELEAAAIIRGIIAHEIMHFVLLHWQKTDLVKTNIDHQIANIAQDALINEQIPIMHQIEHSKAEDFVLGRANGIVLGTNLLKDPNWEALYKKLKEMVPNVSAASQNQNKNNQSNNQDGNGNNQNNQDASDKNSNGLPKPDYDIIDEEFNDVAKEIAREVLEKAVDKLRGTELGNQVEEIIAKLKPKLNWRQILRKVLKGDSKPFKNYSWKRYDKRYDLPPGKISSFKGSKILALVDVSGSMSDEELQQIFTELHSAKQYGFETFVCTYDVVLHDFFRIFTRKVKISGRGGTDVNNALEQLPEFLKKHKHKIDEFDTLVILTDTEDDPPREVLVKSFKTVIIIATQKPSDYYQTNFPIIVLS